MTQAIAETSARGGSAFGGKLPPKKFVSVLEVLDRLMEKGVVADGQIMLSVADIDLIYLNLKFLLAGVAALEQGGGEGDWGLDFDPERVGAPPDDRFQSTVIKLPERESETWKASESLQVQPVPDGQIPFSGSAPKEIQRINTSPEKVEKGLAKLVLTVVELLRLLMERQAVRRMSKGTLSKEEVERLGQAFLKLDQRMKDLKEFFDLEDEDLNLSLGSLGDLI